MRGYGRFSFDVQWYQRFAYAWYKFWFWQNMRHKIIMFDIFLLTVICIMYNTYNVLMLSVTGQAGSYFIYPLGRQGRHLRAMTQLSLRVFNFLFIPSTLYEFAIFPMCLKSPTSKNYSYFAFAFQFFKWFFWVSINNCIEQSCALRLKKPQIDLVK